MNYLKVSNRRQLGILRLHFTLILFGYINETDALESSQKIADFKKLINVEPDCDLCCEFDDELDQPQMNALWALVLEITPAHVVDSELFTLEYKFRKWKPGGYIVFDEFELATIWHESMREFESYETDLDDLLAKELSNFITDLVDDDDDVDMEEMPLPEGMEMTERELASFGVRNAKDSPIVIEWEDRHSLDKIEPVTPPRPSKRQA